MCITQDATGTEIIFCFLLHFRWCESTGHNSSCSKLAMAHFRQPNWRVLGGGRIQMLWRRYRCYDSLAFWLSCSAFLALRKVTRCGRNVGELQHPSQPSDIQIINIHRKKIRRIDFFDATMSAGWPLSVNSTGPICHLESSKKVSRRRLADAVRCAY